MRTCLAFTLFNNHHDIEKTCILLGKVDYMLNFKPKNKTTSESLLGQHYKYLHIEVIMF